MIEVIACVVCIIILAGLCMNHYSMKKTVREHSTVDREIVRGAAEKSLDASCRSGKSAKVTLLSIRDVEYGIATIEMLHKIRMGSSIVKDRTGVDTEKLLENMKKLRRKLFKRACRDCPTLLPSSSSFAQEAGFGEESESEGGGDSDYDSSSVAAEDARASDRDGW